MSQLILTILGFLIVFFGCLHQFNGLLYRPSPFHSHGDNWANSVKHLFIRSKRKLITRFLPASANTTVFKFRLYQLVYGMIGGLIYTLLIFVPSVAGEIGIVISLFEEMSLPEGLEGLGQAVPLATGFFVWLILPHIPPFNHIDTRVRCFLFERAAIPAEQIRESNRLRGASFTPPAHILEKIRTDAKENGFSSDDFYFDPSTKTTRSLWTKCNCLMLSIADWRTDHHYQTAFDQLREITSDSDERSIDILDQHYLDLREEARSFFALKRTPPKKTKEIIQARELVLRELIKAHLKRIYDLLSRVSLHSHHSEKERVSQFKQMGIELEAGASPLPDVNDLTSLAIIIATAITIPLSLALGSIGKGVQIGIIMFSAILIPIYLIPLCPRIAKFTNHHTPRVAFPIMSGIIAFLFGLIVQLASTCLASDASTGSCLVETSRQFTDRTYPWSALHAGMAILVAWRIRLGPRPVASSSPFWRKYRAWGDPQEATVVALLFSGTFLGVVYPMLFLAMPEVTAAGLWPFPSRPMIICLGLGWLVGFFVPTWFRAQAHHYGERRKDTQARASFNKRLEQWRNGAELT